MTMNVLVDQPQARWLPSRHRFAITRLIALAMARRVPTSANKTHEHLILAIDRDQDAIENHAVAVLVFVITASYCAALLPLPLPLAMIVSIPLAVLALHLPIVAGGPVLRMLVRDENHISIVSMGTMGLLLIWSSYIAQAASWARFVAWFFLGLVTMNCLAALILWLMRAQVRAAEERCAP